MRLPHDWRVVVTVFSDLLPGFQKRIYFFSAVTLCALCGYMLGNPILTGHLRPAGRWWLVPELLSELYASAGPANVAAEPQEPLSGGSMDVTLFPHVTSDPGEVPALGRGTKGDSHPICIVGSDWAALAPAVPLAGRNSSSAGTVLSPCMLSGFYFSEGMSIIFYSGMG